MGCNSNCWKQPQRPKLNICLSRSKYNPFILEAHRFQLILNKLQLAGDWQKCLIGFRFEFHQNSLSFKTFIGKTCIFRGTKTSCWHPTLPHQNSLENVWKNFEKNPDWNSFSLQGHQEKDSNTQSSLLVEVQTSPVQLVRLK